MQTADIIALDKWDFWPDTRWAEIAARTVVLRCTEGAGIVDEKYEERVLEAKNHDFRTIPLHIVTSEDARLQKGHFQDVSKVADGARIVLGLAENADLGNLRDAVMAWSAWGTETRPITIRGGDRLRELLGAYHDPVLQRADLWILENHDDKPVFPTKTWADWTLRELPQTSNDPPASVFNGDNDQFVAWLG